MQAGGAVLIHARVAILGPLALALALLPCMARAQSQGWERERLAIFYPDSRQATCAKPDELIYLTQLLEDQFLRVLPAKRYVLIQSADLVKMMRAYAKADQGKTACQDQSCTQIARKAQAKIYLEQRFDCQRGQVSLSLKRLSGGAVELAAQERMPISDLGQLASSQGEKKLRDLVAKLVTGLGVQVVQRGSGGRAMNSTLEVVEARGQAQRGRRGILLLDCNAPQASVILNGRTVGQVESDGIFQQTVDSNVYDLVVRHPLYMPVTRRVTIPAGTVQLRVNLEPNFGSLKVVTQPVAGAVVQLNRKSVGRTPQLIQRLPVGTVSVTVSHELFKTVRERVKIRRQSVTELRFELERKVGELAVMTRPPRARLQLTPQQVDGATEVQTHQTPYVGMLPTGRYNALVSKEGFGTQSHDIQIKENEELTKNWTLPKAHLLRVETIGAKGVQVRLGKEPAQKTPATFSLVPGRYTVRVDDPRFVSRSASVTMPEAGMSQALRLTVRRKPVVKISGSPRGAKVYYAGQSCEAPCEMTVNAGRQCFSVRKSRYLDHSHCQSFQGGQTYSHSFKLQDNTALGRWALDKRKLRRSFDGLSKWRLLGPIYQSGPVLAGGSSVDLSTLPRVTGLSYQRRWKSWLSSRAWAQTSLAGLVKSGLDGKELGVEVLLRAPEGNLSAVDLGLAYSIHGVVADGLNQDIITGYTARLRYLVSEDLQLSPTARVLLRGSGFAADTLLASLSYGLSSRYRLTDRLSLEGAAWLPSLRSSGLLQNYSVGMDWRWLGFSLSGRADRRFESVSSKSWISPKAYCVPPIFEVMSTRLGSTGFIQSGCFGARGVGWSSQRFGFGGVVNLLELHFGGTENPIGFAIGPFLYLRPSDEGILSSSELRLAAIGRLSIGGGMMGELSGDLMFGLGNGWRVGPSLRQIWTSGYRYSSDEESGRDGDSREDDSNFPSSSSSSGMGSVDVLAVGVKAELELGRKVPWRFMGWFHQGVPGLDEHEFSAIGGGVEVLITK